MPVSYIRNRTSDFEPCCKYAGNFIIKGYGYRTGNLCELKGVGILAAAETYRQLLIDACVSRCRIPKAADYSQEKNMDFLNRIVERFIRANKRLKRWQKAVSVLAAVVVFATTYAFVLPAITLDQETASEQSGIEIAASENDPESNGTVYEAESEDEPTQEPVEEPQEEEYEEPQDAQETDPVTEDSGSESESPEAEESSADDNDDRAAEDADLQSADDETGPKGSSDAEDAGPEKTDTETLVDEILPEAEKPEEIKLITEKTQLTYEYIDEEYEDGIEDENEDGIDDGYTVYAEFDAEAKLPVGTTLIAEEITKESDPEAYEAYYEKALSGLQDKYDENTVLSFARFYDIKFVYNGEEVEPAGEVKVRIEYKKAVEIDKETNVDAVHFDKKNDEEPEVIKSEVEAEKKGGDDTVKAVEFESDQFSVYGIVGTETLVAQVITESGDTIRVTVEAKDKKDIVRFEGLRVNELSPESDAYWDAYDAVVAAKEKEEEDFDEETFGFFAADIELLDADGEAFEPEGAVSVKMELVSLPADEDTLLSTMEVRHLAEQDGKIDVQTVAKNSDVSKVDDVITAEFSVDSFSTFTLTWTGEGGESEVISDDDAEAVLNIQNNGETYATVTVHYVDVYGHNIRSPLTDTVNGQTPVSIDGLLNTEIEGYEYKGAHYGTNSGDEITTIAVDRGAGSPVQNYVAQGTTGNSGRPENWNPTTGTEYWGDINGTKARVYYRYQGNNWRFMNVENGGNNSNRYNNGTVYTLETGTSYEYTLSVSNDDAVVATETQNVTGVWQEAADIYLVYENADPDKKHATLHFGTLNSDGSFTDLQETASLDTNAASISVNPTITGQAFIGAYYSETATNTPAVDTKQVDHVLRKVEDAWQYTNVNDKTDKGFIADNSHIYVIYKERTEPATPTPDDDSNIPKPATIKKVYDNGDGTYDIQLDIIGKQLIKEERKGANVLLIFDRTSSMTSNMANAPGDGHRIDGARQAVHTLVNTLKPGTNPVEISVFSFARFADPIGGPDNYDQIAGVDWTETGSSITDFTDGLTLAPSGAAWQTYTYAGGTNWEAALDYAKSYLQNPPDDDPTYIIFLTDGNPTVHNGTASTEGSGVINSTPTEESTEYLAAEVAADNLSTAYKFYGILCANQSDGPLLETLVDHLNSTGHDATHILADDSDKLENSFKDIAEYIIEQLSVSDVSTNDGITSLSSVNASVSGAAGAFKYYKAYEVKYADGKYTYVDDEGVEQEITGDQVETYNYQEDDGEGNVIDKTYLFYHRETWEEAPGASYNTDTGVTWDLSSENNLQEGGIYTIRFTIWPSQAAYDLLADLNNGIKVYEAGHENSITDSERDQVYESGGIYYMKTNTTLDTTYSFSGETYTDEIPYHQGAMDLEARQIFLQKLWPENQLDDYGEGHSLEGIQDEVTLTVTKDKQAYLDVTVKKENDWKEEVFISCGLLTVHDGKVEIKEPGHDYTVIEPGVFSYYWDLIADVYRPMVIGYEDEDLETGAKHEANLLILDESLTEADNINSFELEPGKIYRKQEAGNVTLEASNYRRSNLNLKKIVTGTNAPKDALFEYTVKIKDAGEKEVWFSAMEDTDSDLYQLLETSSNVTPETKTVAGAVYHEEDNTYTYTEGGKEHTRNAADDGTGGLIYTGFYYVASNEEFTIKIKDGWNVRFINLLHGSTFSFTESEDMDQGFSFVGIDTDTQYEFTLVDPDTEWNEIDGRTITGTIVEPNNSFMVDYTNKWENAGFLLEKVKEDRETKISGSIFDLETKEESGSWVKLQTDIKPGGTDTVIDEETGTETVVTIENPVDIGGLGIGHYRFKETKTPDGYILTAEYTYFEVYMEDRVLKVRLTDKDGNPLTDDDGHEVTETETAKLSSEIIDNTTIYKITVTNTPGTALPRTGGPGTGLFTILGAILIAGAGMLLWRRWRIV